VGATELYEEGELEGAIEAVTREVKAHPTDAQRRTLLFELLCFAGDLERASRQLDVIAHQDAVAEPAVQVYRNILHAEHLRRRLYTDSLQPEFLLDPPAFVRLHLEAIGRLREGRFADATALLDDSESTWPPLRGRIDGQPFDTFRDCDDFMAPFLELIVLGDYVWLPFVQVRELEFGAPERPRDLMWIPVRVTLATGAQQRGYVPVLYCDSHRHADNQIKLGRMTDWVATKGGPVRGVGQRMFLAGDEGRSILETRRIEFEPFAPHTG
jgi:type VI secretion system protein ImpE